MSSDHPAKKDIKKADKEDQHKIDFCKAVGSATTVLVPVRLVRLTPYPHLGTSKFEQNDIEPRHRPSKPGV